MRSGLFEPTPAAELRLLLLIDAFSGSNTALEGRTKLAKLDFFLRYPQFMRRALELRAPTKNWGEVINDDETIEGRMVRYRYGPWDPAYFALLGSLVGRGLVINVPLERGLGYRTTQQGHALAEEVSKIESWELIFSRTRLLKRHLNLSGSSLKKFIYDNFPEVSGAQWGTEL